MQQIMLANGWLLSACLYTVPVYIILYRVEISAKMREELSMLVTATSDQGDCNFRTCGLSEL